MIDMMQQGLSEEQFDEFINSHIEKVREMGWKIFT